MNLEKIKPIRFEVNNEPKEEKIKPQIVATEGTKEFNELTKEIKENIEIKENLIKGQMKFYSFFTFIVLIFITILLSSFYDAYFKFIEIFNFSEVLGVTYISLIAILFLIVIKFIFRQRSGLKNLKKVDNFQIKSREILNNPSKESIKYFKEIIKEYEKNPNENLQIEIAKLKSRLKSSLLYEEVIPLLNEHLMKPLDEEVEKLILKYSKNSALFTAISPIAIIDVLMLFWQNYRLSIEIAKIYGFKPTLFSNLIIFKKVIENLIFAGFSESISDILNTSFLAKLSYSISQGIVNGVLTIRIGLTAMKLCRPVPFVKEEKFFKKIFDLMFKSMKKD